MIALLLAFALPASAACPRGWILDRGVTPAGVYTCSLYARADRDDVEPIASYTGYVRCRVGVPLVVSERRVECRRVATTTT